MTKLSPVRIAPGTIEKRGCEDMRLKISGFTALQKSYYLLIHNNFNSCHHAILCVSIYITFPFPNSLDHTLFTDGCDIFIAALEGDCPMLLHFQFYRYFITVPPHKQAWVVTYISFYMPLSSSQSVNQGDIRRGRAHPLTHPSSERTTILS